MQYFVSFGVMERSGCLGIRSKCIADSVPVGGSQRQLILEDILHSLLRTHTRLVGLSICCDEDKDDASTMILPEWMMLVL